MCDYRYLIDNMGLNLYKFSDIEWNGAKIQEKPEILERLLIENKITPLRTSDNKYMPFISIIFSSGKQFAYNLDTKKWMVSGGVYEEELRIPKDAIQIYI